MNENEQKTHNELKIDPWRHVLFLFVIMFSISFQFWNASRAGSFWDYQIDDAIAKLNLDWLKNGVSVSDPNFQTFLPYGYAVTYLIWIPAYLYSKFVRGLEFNIYTIETQNWMIYRNAITYLIYLFGIYALFVWSKHHLKINSKVVSLILLWCFPTVSGYALFNEKDIPIFTGMACAMALTSSSLFSSTKWGKFQQIVFLNASVLFVIGVRPGAAPVLLLIYLIHCAQSNSKKSYLRFLLLGVPAFLYCYLVSASARNLNLRWIFEALNSSAKFDTWQGAMLLWNDKFATPIAGTYYLGVLMSQITLLVFFVIILYFFTILIQAIMQKNDRSEIRVNLFNVASRTLRNEKIVPLLLLLAMVIYSLVSRPMIYDDARQLLFGWTFIMLTFLVILNDLMIRLTSRVLILILSVLSIFPAIDSLKLAPYSYVYRNEIANFVAPNGFETDFWGLSGKENSRWIVENYGQDLQVISNPRIVFQMYSDFPTVKEIEELPNSFLYQQIRRPFGVGDAFPSCKTIHEVTRRQALGPKFIMSIVKLCQK